MPSNQPKKLKFHGEESFMCKGDRTKKRYLMLTAEPNIAKLQESVDVLPLEPSTVLNPTEMPKEAVQTTMTPPVMISVPNWDTMSCQQILEEIKSIQEMLMVSKFSADVVNQYNQIIAEGKATYTSKCESGGGDITPHAPPKLEVPEPTPTPTPTPTGVGTTTITTTGVPIIQTSGTLGGAIRPPVGGGGGGGGAVEKKPTTEKKPNWLLIALLVGGAYLLFRRK